MRLFRFLVVTALVLCLGVVVLGAYVRLSDAGLGCPDWPGCYGQWTVPSGEAAVADAEQQFPLRPLETTKAWKEMVHRYLASLLGLVIIGIALAGRRTAAASAPRQLPWALVALVIFQGVLGMWTVTWLLKPLVVTAHLVGGLLTLGGLLWLWLEVRPRRAPAPSDLPIRHPPQRLARGALLLLVAQILLGGWTSTNYAALACPDLPTCHGQWWPDMDVGEAFTLWRGIGENYEFGVLDNRARITIHWLHRLGALLTSVVLIGLGGVLWRRGPEARRWATLVWGLLALQVTLGVSLVQWQLPLPVATAHNLGAALLWLAMIALIHRLRPVSR